MSTESISTYLSVGGGVSTVIFPLELSEKGRVREFGRLKYILIFFSKIYNMLIETCSLLVISLYQCLKRSILGEALLVCSLMIVSINFLIFPRPSHQRVHAMCIFQHTLLLLQMFLFTTCIPGIEKLFKKLDDVYGIAPDAEVTLEMDPGTFDLARLERLRAAGITRVSVGVQSFSDPLLRACGRAHDLAAVHRALHDLRASSMDSFSLDLIGALPQLDMAEWRNSLRQAADSGCSHVSVYDLQIEPGTAFAKWYRPGEAPLPSEKVAADMYAAAAEELGKAGFEHYEVSNYARPGKRSRHNQRYWRCLPVLAFGMSAANYLPPRMHADCEASGIHANKEVEQRSPRKLGNAMLDQEEQLERFTRPRRWKQYAQFVKALVSESNERTSTLPSHQKSESEGISESVYQIRGNIDRSDIASTSCAISTVSINSNTSFPSSNSSTSTSSANINTSFSTNGVREVDERQRLQQEQFLPDLLDVVMLSLRTADGLDLDLFSRRYGWHRTLQLLRTLADFREKGLVRLVALHKEAKPYMSGEGEGEEGWTSEALWQLALDSHSRSKTKKKSVINSDEYAADTDAGTNPGADADTDADTDASTDAESAYGGALDSRADALTELAEPGAEAETGKWSNPPEITVKRGTQQASRLQGWAVRLTDPKGFLLSNNIISEVFASLAT